MIDRGISSTVLAALMGHESSTITERRYVHLFDRRGRSVSGLRTVSVSQPPRASISSAITASAISVWRVRALQAAGTAAVIATSAVSWPPRRPGSAALRWHAGCAYAGSGNGAVAVMFCSCRRAFPIANASSAPMATMAAPM